MPSPLSTSDGTGSETRAARPWGLCSLLKGSAFPCEALAGALTINRTLTKIDLADNFIGDKGCKALVVLSAHLAFLLLEPGPLFCARPWQMR